MYRIRTFFSEISFVFPALRSFSVAFLNNPCYNAIGSRINCDAKEKFVKTRILAVCPYEALQDLILDIAQERDDVEVTSVVGDLSEGQRLLERVRGMLEGCDAIISRGGTMRMLQENVQTPVIEISSNGFDIMRIVRLLRDYTGKYAMIGTHKTEQDARMISEMLGSSIDLYTLPKDQNPYEQLKTLKEQGYQLVIGGVTVNLIARSLGMNALLITSGREAISAAMDEAVRICRLTAQYKLENQLLRALLTSEGGGAAILDDQGRLLYRSSSLPDVPVDALRKQFEAVLRFGDLATHIRIDQKPYTLQGRRCTIGNAPYVLLRISPCYYIESGMQSWISEQRFSIGSRLFFSTLNGHSEALAKLLSQIQVYAKSPQPIAVYGEPGSGKDDAIHQLHVTSRNRASDLILIDAAKGTKKLWETLLESPYSPLQQLGYSICFKNMQDVPAAMHPALEEYTRTATELHSGRLIFSWTVSSIAQMENDSFYRFLLDNTGALSLRVPSLRERIEDIPSLLSVMISECNTQLGRQIFGTEEGVLPLLQACDWPFNFIQFRQLVRDAVMLSAGSQITTASVQNLLASIRSTPGQNAFGALNLNQTLDEINQDVIQIVLREENFNYTRTAARLGISRSSLWRKTRQ